MSATAAERSVSLYTVLVEGDDFNDPVADSARSILDGHIVLSRRLANSKHFPAIDALESVSRVRDQVVSDDGCERTSPRLSLHRAIAFAFVVVVSVPQSHAPEAMIERANSARFMTAARS